MTYMVARAVQVTPGACAASSVTGGVRKAVLRKSVSLKQKVRQLALNSGRGCCGGSRSLRDPVGPCSKTLLRSTPLE